MKLQGSAGDRANRLKAQDGHPSVFRGSTPVIVYEALAVPSTPEPTVGCFRNGINVITEFQSLKMLVIALLWEASCVAIHMACVKYIWHRGVAEFGKNGAPPLRDVVHDTVPSLQFIRFVPEVGMLGSIFYLVWLMLWNFDERSLDCFRTALWAHGAIMLSRGLSFSSTLLPDASQTCHTSQYLGACHDLLFSGHAAMLVLIAGLTQKFFFLHPAVRVTVIVNAAFQVCASRGGAYCVARC
jgi:hypothetical protein